MSNPDRSAPRDEPFSETLARLSEHHDCPACENDGGPCAVCKPESGQWISNEELAELHATIATLRTELRQEMELRATQNEREGRLYEALQRTTTPASAPPEPTRTPCPYFGWAWCEEHGAFHIPAPARSSAEEGTTTDEQRASPGGEGESSGEAP